MIAQAFGEYGASALIAEAFQSAYFYAQYAIGAWGTQVFWIVCGGAVLLSLLNRFR